MENDNACKSRFTGPFLAAGRNRMIRNREMAERLRGGVSDDSSASTTEKKKKRGKVVEHDHDIEAEQTEEYGPHLPSFNPLDEIPIIKSGPSSFEELLERELAKEQATKQDLDNNTLASGSSGPKSNFLKKGEAGIFNA